MPTSDPKAFKCRSVRSRDVCPYLNKDKRPQQSFGAVVEEKVSVALFHAQEVILGESKFPVDCQIIAMKRLVQDALANLLPDLVRQVAAVGVKKHVSLQFIPLVCDQSYELCPLYSVNG